MGGYSFDNIPHEGDPDSDTVISLIHPSLDDFLFEESGNINIANASLVTGSTVLLGLCCTHCVVVFANPVGNVL